MAVIARTYTEADVAEIQADLARRLQGGVRSDSYTPVELVHAALEGERGCPTS